MDNPRVGILQLEVIRDDAAKNARYVLGLSATLPGRVRCSGPLRSSGTLRSLLGSQVLISEDNLL